MSDIQRYAFTKDSMVACCCSVDACTDGDYMLCDTHKAKVSALEGALFQRDKKIERLEARVKALAKALSFLAEVKDHKDEYGKDQWYLDAQPIAWDDARNALKDSNHE